MAQTTGSVTTEELSTRIKACSLAFQTEGAALPLIYSRLGMTTDLQKREFTISCMMLKLGYDAGLRRAEDTLTARSRTEDQPKKK